MLMNIAAFVMIVLYLFIAENQPFPWHERDLPKRPAGKES